MWPRAHFEEFCPNLFHFNKFENQNPLETIEHIFQVILPNFIFQISFSNRYINQFFKSTLQVWLTFYKVNSQFKVNITCIFIKFIIQIYHFQVYFLYFIKIILNHQFTFQIYFSRLIFQVYCLKLPFNVHSHDNMQLFHHYKGISSKFQHGRNHDDDQLCYL